ncbi:hypothetical protein [Mycobacterium leprae]|uniref:hypothetical protein n=1 Tax=Mycobacterium leprae TaxID=1769 RepID=UPI0019550586|nr:hypothetical protein [Mycobacterium leprae]
MIETVWLIEGEFCAPQAPPHFTQPGVAIELFSEFLVVWPVSSMSGAQAGSGVHRRGYRLLLKHWPSEPKPAVWAQGAAACPVPSTGGDGRLRGFRRRM